MWNTATSKEQATKKKVRAPNETRRSAACRSGDAMLLGSGKLYHNLKGMWTNQSYTPGGIIKRHYVCVCFAHNQKVNPHEFVHFFSVAFGATNSWQNMLGSAVLVVGFCIYIDKFTHTHTCQITRTRIRLFNKRMHPEYYSNMVASSIPAKRASQCVS